MLFRSCPETTRTTMTQQCTSLRCVRRPARRLRRAQRTDLRTLSNGGCVNESGWLIDRQDPTHRDRNDPAKPAAHDRRQDPAISQVNGARSSVLGIPEGKTAAPSWSGCFGGLTFEVSWRRRQAARRRQFPCGVARPAVGSQLDRRVRPLPRRACRCLKRHRVACHPYHCCVCDVRGLQDYPKRGPTPTGGGLNQLTARRSTPARSALNELA